MRFGLSQSFLERVAAQRQEEQVSETRVRITRAYVHPRTQQERRVETAKKKLARRGIGV
jgi:hypothetical protein